MKMFREKRKNLVNDSFISRKMRMKKKKKTSESAIINVHVRSSRSWKKSDESHIGRCFETAPDKYYDWNNKRKVNKISFEDLKQLNKCKN